MGIWSPPSRDGGGACECRAAEIQQADRFRSAIAIIDRKGRKMKKPVLSIEEPEPKKALRADRPPTEGFVTIVDGHFKSEFDDVEAAQEAGRKLKAAYPMLQIEIYDAVNKARTLLT